MNEAILEVTKLEAIQIMEVSIRRKRFNSYNVLFRTFGAFGTKV